MRTIMHYLQYSFPLVEGGQNDAMLMIMEEVEGILRDRKNR